MPNTPALIGAGATGLCANARVSPAQKAQAQHILDAAGLTRWIDDEALMDTVTALSGSGPAYFFVLVEALEDAAVAQGLPRDTARMLAAQTCLGAGRMLAESGEAPANCASASPRPTAPPRPRWKASPPTACRASSPMPWPPPPDAARNWPPNWTQGATPVSYLLNAFSLLLELCLRCRGRAVRAARLAEAVRADFHNPISQFLYRYTNPVLAPIRRVLPNWRRLNLAALLLAGWRC